MKVTGGRHVFIYTGYFKVPSIVKDQRLSKCTFSRKEFCSGAFADDHGIGLFKAFFRIALEHGHCENFKKIFSGPDYIFFFDVFCFALYQI